MGADCNICSTKCYGIKDNHGSCCTLDNRDYIIGPHHDTKEFLGRLSERFGREIKHNDVFAVFDDRPQVIDLWWDLKLPVFHVGDYRNNF